MENNLIENKTTVFYTIKSTGTTAVCEADFYGGKVDRVEVTQTAHKVKKFTSKETAQKIAMYIDGTLIKHTRTEIITEVTEELKLEEEK